MKQNLLDLPQKTRIQIQGELINEQQAKIKQQMKEVNKQTEELLDSEYFLFFGEANK
jgi:hypothetical protein